MFWKKKKFELWCPVNMLSFLLTRRSEYWSIVNIIYFGYFAGGRCFWLHILVSFFFFLFTAGYYLLF